MCFSSRVYVLIRRTDTYLLSILTNRFTIFRFDYILVHSILVNPFPLSRRDNKKKQEVVVFVTIGSSET